MNKVFRKAFALCNSKKKIKKIKTVSLGRQLPLLERPEDGAREGDDCLIGI